MQALGIPGAGPSLVLLPGMVGDGDVFAQQAPLGRLGAVYAVDLPNDPALDRLDAIASRLTHPAGPAGPARWSLGALVARALARQLDEWCAAWSGSERSHTRDTSPRFIDPTPPRVGPRAVRGPRVAPAPRSRDGSGGNQYG